MNEILSYLILGLLGFTSLFIYTRRSFLISLLPGAVAFGLMMLVFRTYSTGLDESIVQHWDIIPKIMINVVFASLFIGRRIVGPRKIWKYAGPQVVFGQTLAWGQYVIGSVLAMLVLVPIFKLSPLSGALIEISFEGGHGTAAGLQPLFNELNFSEGADLALGLATVGLVVGLATGLIMNGIHRKENNKPKRPKKKAHRPSIKLHSYVIRTRNRYFARHVILQTIIQLLLIGLAIVIGMLIKESLVLFESTVIAQFSTVKFFAYIPLFPLAMIGGVIVQLGLKALNLQTIVKARTIDAIADYTLELLIIAAVASISLVAITDNMGPFIILAVAGIVWNLVAFLWLAPRLMKKYWFERGIGDYGQSMGMTATGLLLIHVADPQDKAEAIERFGYKQLLFEPIVGGGIFTASSMLIIADFGLSSLLAISSIVLTVWLIIGYFMIKNNSRAQKA